jgi:hypothetical protein
MKRHLGESDLTCGAARSILPGRASHEVRAGPCDESSLSRRVSSRPLRKSSGGESGRARPPWAVRVRQFGESVLR